MIFAFILPLQAARCGLQHGFYAKTSLFKAAQIVSSFVPHRWVGSNKEAQKFIHSKSSQKPVLCQTNINVTWRAPQAEIKRMILSRICAGGLKPWRARDVPSIEILR
jgi:hypothetical protein